MSEQRIESDVVYDHERYGEVLVTGIAKMYDEWDVAGPQDDIESGNTLVYFYDNYDGYGGMDSMPLSEPINEFAKSVNRVRIHEYVDPYDRIEERMEERDYTEIDPEDYT